MTRRLKRGLASLLAAVMLVSMLPAALAAEADGEDALPQPTEEEVLSQPAGGDVAEPASLLPLPEYRFSVNLEQYVGSELEAVPLSELLTDTSDPENPICYYENGDTVVWGKYNGSDRYTISQGNTIDLSGLGYGTQRLELIVGSGDQFDPGNIRCIVNVTLVDPATLLNFTIKADGNQTVTTDPTIRPRVTEDGTLVNYCWLDSVSFWGKDDIKLTLSFKETAGTAGLTATVYQGFNYEDFDDSDMTTQMWGDDAPGFDVFYVDEDGTAWSMGFTIVYKRGANIVCSILCCFVIPTTDPYGLLDFAVYDETGTEIQTRGFSYSYYQSGDNDKYDYRYSATVAKTDLERATNASLVMKLKSGFADAAGVTARVTANGQDVTGAMWWSDTTTPHPGGYRADYTKVENQPQFQVELRKDGKTCTLDFGVRVSPSEITVRHNYGPLYSDQNGYRSRATGNPNSTSWSGNSRVTYIFTMVSEQYSAGGTYYLNLYLNNSDPTAESSVNGIDFVACAVLGDYATREQIENQTDIKTSLFSTASSYTMGTGYAADFRSGPVTFTVLDTEGGIHHVTYQLEPYVSAPATGTYLRVSNANNSENSPYDAYEVKAADDSYYDRGYQTIFLLDDGNPVTDATIKPLFTASNGATIYRGHDESGSVQTSGVSEVDFTSGQALRYSAAAGDRTHLDNYQVTFLTQQAGAKLFVNAVSNSMHRDDNGVALREVRLLSASSYHDVLLANVGVEKLTGLSVTLSDNPLIKLDDYWTIQNNSIRELAGFTTTTGTYTVVDENGDPIEWTAGYGELPNLAKVRLVPILDEDGRLQSGVVDATMTISSTNGGSETIKLTGLIGNLAIVTQTMAAGVKYVPYSQLIQTNALKGAGDVVFELVQEDGPLPNGLVLYPNGEIYGAPQAAGEWTFTVRAYFKGYEDEAVTRTFTIAVAENTDENVYMTSDGTSETGGNYLIKQPIGNDVGNYHYVLTRSGAQRFISYGEFPEFVKIWLDGKELYSGDGYDATSGSTVITIWGETISGKNDGNSHTISAEFRTGGGERSGELKRTSQNFVINLEPVFPAPDGGSSGSSGSTQNPNTSNSSGTPTTTTPGTTPEPSSGPFDDVRSSDWFYDDVKWAYDQGLMIGVSDRLFAPTNMITQATVVTLLARMSNVDLTRYDGITEDGIEPDQWYTNAAIWAKRAGLLPDNEPFKGTEPIARADMAIMLVKYLRSMGVDTSMPKNPINFADADLMSEADNNAFQVLYQYGIFKGVGELRMDPTGFTTRAQFAALIHRISAFVQAQSAL